MRNITNLASRSPAEFFSHTVEIAKNIHHFYNLNELAKKMKGCKIEEVRKLIIQKFSESEERRNEMTQALQNCSDDELHKLVTEFEEQDILNEPYGTKPLGRI